MEYLAALSESVPCQNSDLLAISVQEKIAAYELLGASLFDRHSLVQDAIASWFQALKLRQEVGLSPKCLTPSIALCSCHYMNTNFRDGYPSSDKEGEGINSRSNGWPLVSLAAREALALTEAVRDPDYNRSSVSSDNLCTTCSRTTATSMTDFEVEKDLRVVMDGASPSNDLYARKKSSLRSELYFAYRLELQRIMTQSAQSQKFLADVDSPKMNWSSHSTCNSDPSVHNAENQSIPSSVSAHSPLTSVQISTPAEPLLGQEPLCWVAPRCRRWSVDHTCSRRALGPSLSANETLAGVDCSQSFTKLNRCRRCNYLTVRFGHRIRRRPRGLCTPCVLKSEVQGELS